MAKDKAIVRDKFIMTSDVESFLKATTEGDKAPIDTVFFMGPAGCGKTSLVYEMADRMGVKEENVVRYMCSKDTTAYDLTTDKTVQKGEIIDVVTSVLSNMCKDNSITYLDEVLTLQADVAVKLNSLLDHTKELTMPNGQTFKRGVNSIVVLSSNPPGYAGVKRQHGGFMDRFPILNMGYANSEEKIIMERHPDVEEVTALRLKQLAELVRNGNRTSDMRTECSTRALLMMAKMISNGASPMDAVRGCLNIPPDEVKAVNEFVKLVLNAELVKEEGKENVLDLMKGSSKKLKDKDAEIKLLTADRDKWKKKCDDIIKAVS